VLILISVVQVFYGATPEASQGWDGVSITMPWPDFLGGDLHITLFDGWFQSSTLFGITGAITWLTIAVALGILAGIRAVSSGLSDASEKLIFRTTVFMGLWGALSAVSVPFLTDESFVIEGYPNLGMIFWMVLTLLFVIGFAFNESGGE